eukprot:7858553-Ditylum_brightwellii.AAC.1
MVSGPVERRPSTLTCNIFIKDKIESREVKVKHCDAQEMIADYFTKPLQGHLFYKFRKAILNLEND